MLGVFHLSWEYRLKLLLEQISYGRLGEFLDQLALKVQFATFVLSMT